MKDDNIKIVELEMKDSAEVNVIPGGGLACLGLGVGCAGLGLVCIGGGLVCGLAC